jgi:hypothetical protein
MNNAKATFTGPSPRHTQATTTGHPEGTKPKQEVEIRAAKGGEGHVMCEMIKTKTLMALLNESHDFMLFSFYSFKIQSCVHIYNMLFKFIQKEW